MFLVLQMLWKQRLEKTPPKPVLVSTTTGTDEDIDNDYKYQRENFYNLIEEDRMQLMAS